MDFPHEPALLRKFIFNERKKIDLTQKHQAFQQILKEFAEQHWYKKAMKILAYYGKIESGEFDTRPLLEKILNDNKELYLPRCVPYRYELEIYRIRDYRAELILGEFQLHEPIPNQNNLGQIDEMDIIIVPGLVFDEKKARYGYGKGYYDRLLSKLKNPNVKKVSFTLDAFVMNFQLKIQSTDIPMDIIITEKRLI